MGIRSRMQSSIYSTSSPRHHSSHATSKRPRPHTSRSRASSRGESHSSISDVASDSLLGQTMANGDGHNGSKPSNSELDKIRRNSLYMTFNAPQVDDYHRGLFLTHPPLRKIPDPSFSGTLFHASYTDSVWILDQRAVKDVSTSQSLVLLYRLGTLDPNMAPIEEQFDRIREVLKKVPLGREAREKELGPKTGNKVLGGYDCVIWTCDAITALVKAGMVDFGCRSVDEVIAAARALAGPADAKSMVGVDFGGIRVVN